MPARVVGGMESHQPTLLMVTLPSPELAAVSKTVTAVGALGAVVMDTG